MEPDKEITAKLSQLLSAIAPDPESVFYGVLLGLELMVRHPEYGQAFLRSHKRFLEGSDLLEIYDSEGPGKLVEVIVHNIPLTTIDG